MFLTSNNTRELSEALKRRCLYLHIDYPDLEREKEIVLTKVPDITEHLADQVARIVRSIRQLELKKAPSVSETLDWARTLLLLGIEHIDAETAATPSTSCSSTSTDIAKAEKEFSTNAATTFVASRPRERRRVRPWTVDARRRRPPIADARCRRVHPGAARGRAAGVAHREPRRHGGGQAHPARGPRGVQVRARRHAGEEPRALEGVRDVFEVYFSLRGREYGIGDATRRRSPSCPRTPTAGREAIGDRAGARGGGGEALTPEELAEMLYQALLHGDEALMRALARQAVRRFAAWSRAGPSAAPTTCTARCGTSTSTACSSG